MMKTIIFAFLSALVAVLATLALAGYIFFRITKRYFDNQQKSQCLGGCSGHVGFGRVHFFPHHEAVF